MIVINTVSDTKFSYNGITYHKNFMPFVVGNKISILNAYDGCIFLTDSPTHFSEYTVNGVTYASVALLQAALLDVIYTRLSLGGGSGISGNGTVGRIAKFTDTDAIGDSILSETGNAIHLTNGGSSYASFGIINPGIPGGPGVDNDAYVGSTINNDFLIRVNNTEALRIDTALRLKIANIQNAPTDTDKFLVSDLGVIKYRTGAEILSDIGGQGALSLTTTGSSGAATLIGNTLNIPNYGSALSGYVPYTGATADLNLGSRALKARVLDVGQSGAQGYIRFSTGGIQSFPDQTGVAPIGTTGIGFNFLGGTAKKFVFEASGISDGTTRTYTMPNTSGTLALTSNLSAYQPLLTNPITGTGTTNFIPKFTGVGSIGNSAIFENGGNVGIGTTSPSGKLHVKQISSEIPFILDTSSASSPSYTQYRVNNSSGWELGMAGVGDAYSFLFSYGDFGTANSKLAITSGGNLLLGTTTDTGYKLDVNGTFRATGAATFSSSVTATAFFESSDLRLKTLIIDNYQSKGIESITAKLYTKNGVTELGYFAQDVQSVLPSAVIERMDGFLDLSYRQVHTAKIANLEREIKDLKELIKNLNNG